jgi:hypothetical protein
VNAICRSARIAVIPNDDREETLKALAAELGYILHPKSRTLCIFGDEYIFAKVPVARHFNSEQLLLFPEATNESSEIPDGDGASC